MPEVRKKISKVGKLIKSSPAIQNPSYLNQVIYDLTIRNDSSSNRHLFSNLLAYY